MKLIVTGGCGFIGSNFIEKALSSDENVEIVNIDIKTYAGQGKNIEHMGLADNPRYKFFQTDICNGKEIQEIFQKENPDMVINFAAESHVDRSIEDPMQFVKTNVLGTGNLLEASRKNNVKLFVQISTDEVYGSLSAESTPSKESDILLPRSPYSASKADAEHLALSYFHTYGMPVIVTRSSNNYGPYQYPEKLIPLFTTNLMDKKKVPLMYSKENPGQNVRDWIYVKDNCEAIWQLLQKGVPGNIYNVSGGNEKTNIEITKTILDKMNFGEDMIKHIPHRKGHDFRYAINDSKLKETISLDRRDFQEAMNETIEWYISNEDWWRPIKKEKGVIFGNGFLGNRIAEEMGFEIAPINVLNTSELKAYLEEKRPDVVINCVGKTGRPNIDWCEDNKEDTILSNTAAPIIISSLCSKQKIYFVHIGSGCVYQGEGETHNGYLEKDKANNTGNIYVRSKIISEEALRELPGLQLRIRMPLDDRPGERNFIDKILKYESLIDEQNSMTTVPHFIQALKKMIEKRAEGVYNFTNPGTISAAEIMTIYKEIVDPKHQFEVITSQELDAITKVKRSNCFLNTEKMKSLGIALPEVHSAVRECLINYKKKSKK